MIRFDVPRHRTILGLPADWPRINSYPEWFTVDESASYGVIDVQTGKVRRVSGAELAKGLPIELRRGDQMRLVVSRELSRRVR